jgi:DNA gyrase/topoisomerase IV subunit A
MFKIKPGNFKSFLEFENDEIIKVICINDINKNNVITILSKSGLVHRFFEQSFKETAPGGKGLMGMNLKSDDTVVDFVVTNNEFDNENNLIIFNKFEDETNGIKNMKLEEFKPKGRISQGIVGIEFSKKLNGEPTKLAISKDILKFVDSKGKIQEININKVNVVNRGSKPINFNFDINYILED